MRDRLIVSNFVAITPLSWHLEPMGTHSVTGWRIMVGMFKKLGGGTFWHLWACLLVHQPPSPTFTDLPAPVSLYYIFRRRQIKADQNESRNWRYQAKQALHSLVLNKGADLTMLSAISCPLLEVSSWHGDDCVGECLGVSLSPIGHTFLTQRADILTEVVSYTHTCSMDIQSNLSSPGSVVPGGAHN